MKEVTRDNGEISPSSIKTDQMGEEDATKDLQLIRHVDVFEKPLSFGSSNLEERQLHRRCVTLASGHLTLTRACLLGSRGELEEQRSSSVVFAAASISLPLHCFSLNFVMDMQMNATCHLALLNPCFIEFTWVGDCVWSAFPCSLVVSSSYAFGIRSHSGLGHCRAHISTLGVHFGHPFRSSLVWESVIHAASSASESYGFLVKGRLSAVPDIRH